MTRKKGGRISLTAFEAAWLHMVADPNPADALAALPYLGLHAPRRVEQDPSEAWGRIVDKIASVAPEQHQEP